MTETYVMAGDTAILRHLEEFGESSSMSVAEKTWIGCNWHQPIGKGQSVHGVTYYEAIKVPAIVSV